MRLGQEFAAGDRYAARRALVYCILNDLPLPEWLGTAILDAIRTSDRGKPDDLLGFGNERMLAKWRKGHLQARDEIIRQWFDGFEGERPSKRRFIEMMSQVWDIGPKAVEKILYGKGSPTRRVKK